MPERIAKLDYVRAHLEEALATDSRLAQGGLRVSIDGDELVITGSVPATPRHEAVARIAAEVARGFHVRNETTLVSLDEPLDDELVRDELVGDELVGDEERE